MVLGGLEGVEPGLAQGVVLIGGFDILRLYNGCFCHDSVAYASGLLWPAWEPSES